MSITDALVKISSYIPEVKRPLGEVPLKRRIMWSAVALMIYFILGHIPLIGLTAEAKGRIDFMVILGSTMGTLATAGIGPIVFASLLLQMLVGAKLIEIDLADPKGRAKFQSIQKLAIILFCIFEGFVYPMSGWISGNTLLLAMQITLGSIILFYLDDLIGKYGIGSGISLFIAGGVSYHLLLNLFRPSMRGAEVPGLIWQFFNSLTAGSPNYILLLPLIVTIAMFLVVIYAQSMYVNIPITIGRAGFGGRFPVRLLYVSVLPVIFASALFANIQLFTAMVKDVPILGDIGRYVTWATGSGITEQLMPSQNAGYWTRFQYSVNNFFQYIILQISSQGFGVLAKETLRVTQALLFLVIFVVTCVIFGKLWIVIGGQSPEDIAEQLESSGMYIPGFRRDSRVTVKILERYIPTIAVLGSIFIGLLAAIGDMSLGGLTSGTGILLTVGIIENLYEQLVRLKLKDMHPIFKKLLG